ncbi:MAG: acyl-CoA thioesterase [Burkholderiales bacterium]
MSDAEFHSVVASFPCQVHWGDCDPAGIIFYPTYFRWMDAACWAFFASAGYDAKRMRAEHLAMPLVAADCQFLYPAEQGDRCEVRSRILRFGGKSFVVSHEVQREDGMALARGSETRVWGKFENGPGTRMRGAPIPDSLKARFLAA